MTQERVVRLASPAQLEPGGLWELHLVPCPDDAVRAQLTPADRARLARLPPTHRNRLLARRAIVPALAAKALGCSPQELMWSSEDGPRVVRAWTGRELHVSISVSGSRCLLALSSLPVGVDLEVLSDVPEALAIAELLLSRSEQAWISGAGAAGPATVSDRFLRTWVRKEAVVKCTGTGLTGCDSRAFNVDASVAVGEVRDASGRVTGMITLDVPLEGAVAAVAGTPRVTFAAEADAPADDC